jgi:glycerol-3-phosphate acyltransferase PlsY
MISRYVSLASIASAVVFPATALFLGRGQLTPVLVAVILFLPLLVIVKHHQNIGRLIKGTEYRFGKAKA